jgi:hypothetical protein
VPLSVSQEPQSEPASTPGRFNIPKLLEYSGPSFEVRDSIPDSIMLLDYRNTDANADKIARLLSSQSIPFQIERPNQGWRGRVRLIVAIPRNRLEQAEAVLNAAVRASEIEVVQGTDDLRSR